MNNYHSHVRQERRGLRAWRRQGDYAILDKLRYGDLTIQLDRMLRDQIVFLFQDRHRAQEVQWACGDRGPFREVDGPRRRDVIYLLINVVTIALCAVICGTDDLVAIVVGGRAKRNGW